MGQLITVATREGVSPEVRHFDLNRSLTGMDTCSFRSAADATGVKPPDELARRLFALGAEAVTIYSSVVTVKAPVGRWAEMRPEVEDTIANLFIYYGEGVEVAPATPPADPAASPE